MAGLFLLVTCHAPVTHCDALMPLRISTHVRHANHGGALPSLHRISSHPQSTRLLFSQTASDDDNGTDSTAAAATTTTTTTTTTTADTVAKTANTPPATPWKSTVTQCVTGVAFRTGPLNEAVAKLVPGMSLDTANDLVAWGAVWARMEGLSATDLLAQYEDDDDDEDTTNAAQSRSLYADVGWKGNDDEDDLDAYLEQMQQQRFRRILTPSIIEAGTDLRIYPQPRRFPACAQLTRTRLLYEDTTFIVVDKPPLLPCQPDASNYYECAPGCVYDHMGTFLNVHGQVLLRRPLLCHRVDSCVGGCLVLSKDRHGQKVFQGLQRDRQIRKVYRALTSNPVPCGPHVHWMWSPRTSTAGGPPGQWIRHAPPDSRRKARQFWQRCVLEVVSCEAMEIPNSVLYNSDDDLPPSTSGTTKTMYESTIRLVTGRKHQVRAQLASLGAPIWRDTLYTPLAGWTLDRLEQEQLQQEQANANNSSDDEASSEDTSLAAAWDGALSQVRVPTTPIGLHAQAIAFGSIRVQASPPWWRPAVSAKPTVPAGKPVKQKTKAPHIRKQR
jgi:23S rRNA-/tRNA-specific pseudouridylate synthase